jgi:hypothetical protein
MIGRRTAARRPSRTGPVALLAATVVGLTAAGCSTTGTPVAAPPPATLTAALGTVPSGVGLVEIIDMDHARARWNMSGVNGTTDPDSAAGRAYLARLTSTGSGTDLDAQFQLFRDANTGWNAWDVQWEARWSGDGPPVSVYKLRDDLDMQTVIKSFEAEGMQRSGTDDAVRFDGKLSADAVLGRAFLSGATVLPARHLVVAGTAGGATLPAASTDSLAGNAAATALTAGSAPADYVELAVGDQACVRPGAAMGTATTPAQAQEIAASWAGLTAITGVLVAATDDTTVDVVTGYPSDADAQQDLPARQHLLSTPSLATRQPYTELFSATAAQQGNRLTYDITGDRAAQRVRQMVQRLDTPWAFCP